MNVEAVSRSNATLTLSAEELVLLFGCTVEATEALSASEFHARVGQAEAEAERLGSQLKETLAEMSRLDMPNDV